MVNSQVVRRRHPRAPYGDDESSWTSYVQAFLEMGGTSSGGGGCAANSFTMTSDAGSRSNCNKLVSRGGGGGGRRRRVKAAAEGDVGDDEEDDDLKDTASSPLNRPEVCFLNDLGIVSRERKEGDRSRKKSHSQDGVECVKRIKVAEEGMELLRGRRSYEYPELRKRGLCLVPVSMLLDYLK